MYPSFLDFWCKNASHLLYTLRIDNSAFVVYNKARNQRSTAEAQTRANPADLKQKGARPMVDMEPAQFGQTVGIRWEAKQRLTTNGMFPPYKNTTTSRSWASITRKQNSLSSINPLAIQIDPHEVIPMMKAFARTRIFEWPKRSNSNVLSNGIPRKSNSKECGNMKFIFMISLPQSNS